jgi:hypothetical protein
MVRAVNLTTALVAILLGATALAGCTATIAPQTEPSQTPTVRATPTPTYLTELPEWAQGTTWLIYPDGMKCFGTEGCPNDYRALIGEPGPVLPDGVEYYDPAKHDCVLVRPLGVNCSG